MENIKLKNTEEYLYIYILIYNSIWNFILINYNVY